MALVLYVILIHFSDEVLSLGLIHSII